jgi:hypothetical protein
MKTWSMAGLLLAFAIGGWLLGNRTPPALAADNAQAGFPDQTVVSSDGTNLVVTDNRAHKVYYYSLDDDEEFGAHMKLRGKIDLAQIGKPELVTELPPPKKQP